MNYFRFSYENSQKGFGKAILFAFILGLALSSSVVVYLSKQIPTIINTIDYVTKEDGCQINNDQLQCDQDVYQYKNIIIDLRNDTSSDDTTSHHVFTKDGWLVQNRTITYKDMINLINAPHTMSQQEMITHLNSEKAMIYSLAFIFIFLGGTIYFLVANFILAYFMRVLVKLIKRIEIPYMQMYKLTFYVVLPYVLFNAVCRAALGFSIGGFIDSLVPYLGTILHITFDYAVIYWLIHLTLMERHEEDDENSLQES